MDGRDEAEQDLEDRMKTSNTIAAVLKSKSENRILSIAPDDSVYEAIEKMAEYDVGALMVIANGRLEGVLSERDYTRKGILMGHPSRETRVGQIMTSPVISVTPQHSVDECMALMTERHIRHLPVLQGETVVGMISIGDLVKWVITGHEETIQALQGYITGGYPV
jgi:CBS domain-containing protein